jgi:hypothetical protein
MLRPSKHAHPDQTVLNAAFLMLRSLKKARIEKYEALRGKVRKAISGGDALFLPGLSLLFLLGLIRYHGKTDSIEYVGPNGAL